MGEKVMKVSTSSVSAIVIYGGKWLNQKLLDQCLRSIEWVDEKILVETDKLKDKDFSSWRNYGASKAKSEWLLYVDSDEQITPELQKEIKEVIEKKDSKEVAYAIPRKNIFLGHPMSWGGWSPDYVLRLIRKDSLSGWSGDLHEQPKINGEVGKLKNPIIHITHRNLSEMVEKTNIWSDVEAQLLFESGHPPMVWWRFFSIAFREFWYRAILKLGFLDGPVGIIEIIYQMFSRTITYAKLWELQLKAKQK